MSKVLSATEVWVHRTLDRFERTLSFSSSVRVVVLEERDKIIIIISPMANTPVSLPSFPSHYLPSSSLEACNTAETLQKSYFHPSAVHAQSATHTQLQRTKLYTHTHTHTHTHTDAANPPWLLYSAPAIASMDHQHGHGGGTHDHWGRGGTMDGA